MLTLLRAGDLCSLAEEAIDSDFIAPPDNDTYTPLPIESTLQPFLPSYCPAKQAQDKVKHLVCQPLLHGKAEAGEDLRLVASPLGVGTSLYLRQI